MIAAAEQLRNWREHPTRMVEELFGVRPDMWQHEALESFPHSPRMAFQACRGPGKTSTLAWIAWNYLLTRPHPMIGATSISGANLKANLWTELNRWRAKSQLLQHFFEQTKSEIFLREHPATWKLEARTWPTDADAQQIGTVLAGVHAPFVMWLLDEVGDYPDAILPTCEAIFAGEPKEAHIVMAGNPTKLSGPLYRAATTARNLWRVFQISAAPDDPKRTPRVSVEHARQMIAQYGETNPWIRVSIFGEFPPSSLNALIGPDEVATAMKRYHREFDIRDYPRIIGCDVARYGDDSSVLCPRQGQQVFPLSKFRNLNSTQGAGVVSRLWQEWSADAVFIDDTGGFGSGWIDGLCQLGRSPIGVHFAGEAHNKGRYANKRAEMYFEAVEWIKRGGALPDSPEMLAGLTAVTYMFQGDRFLIEPKDQVKRKLGYSPDEADAFVLTFAEKAHSARSQRRPARVEYEYDPFRWPQDNDE
jgi:phage terminase large subunit